MYTPVVLQQCILGQHGYWWAMGAMYGALLIIVHSIPLS
jgi:hypothetical protein